MSYKQQIMDLLSKIVYLNTGINDDILEVGRNADKEIKLLSTNRAELTLENGQLLLDVASRDITIKALQNLVDISMQKTESSFTNGSVTKKLLGGSDE